jgi:hypothetical protein
MWGRWHLESLLVPNRKPALDPSGFQFLHCYGSLELPWPDLKMNLALSG